MYFPVDKTKQNKKGYLKCKWLWQCIHVTQSTYEWLRATQQLHWCACMSQSHYNQSQILITYQEIFEECVTFSEMTCWYYGIQVLKKLLQEHSSEIHTYACNVVHSTLLVSALLLQHTFHMPHTFQHTSPRCCSYCIFAVKLKQNASQTESHKLW